MAVPYEQLLGNTGRPIILNGSLLTNGRSALLAKMSRNSFSCETTDGRVSLSKTELNNLINERVAKFTEAYGFIFNSPVDELESLDSSVDNYTSAVVINSSAYTALMDVQLHQQLETLHPKIREALVKVVAEYTLSFYTNYLYLFNRRLASPYMGMKTRAHFAAGLFQPLVVGTKLLPSPLEYAENNWFRELFSSTETWLERHSDSSRKLNLSCVSMNSISTVFGTEIIVEYDRRFFVMLMTIVLLQRLDPSNAMAKTVTETYRGLFSQAITNPYGRTQSADPMYFKHDYGKFFAQVLEYCNRRR